MINMKLRWKNPYFLAQVVLAIFTPIFAYFHTNIESLTSIGDLGTILFQSIQNPYLLTIVATSLFNAIQDPTTKGLKDSNYVLEKDSLDQMAINVKTLMKKENTTNTTKEETNVVQEKDSKELQQKIQKEKSILCNEKKED